MATLRIGTRGSDLARWQARRVQALLADRGTASELIVITTSGDETRRGPPPPAAPGFAVKGLFTKEIEDALLDGRVDVAVHSLKDLMVDLPDGLVIAAVPEREDPRDGLVTSDGRTLDALPPGARVGTSSLRRRAALANVRPDLEITTLRGNVPTRVRRVEQGAVDGAILALAGLRRLGLAARAVPLDPRVFVPAPGQGALAVEARADDPATHAALRPLDDAEIRAAIEAERGALAVLEAGCNVPIGAACHRDDEGGLTLYLRVYAVDGSRMLSVEVPVDRQAPRASGAAAARRLEAEGARSLIEEAVRAAEGDRNG